MSWSKPKQMSACCERPAKLNLNDPQAGYFCTHCGADCTISDRKEPFRGSTLSNIRKTTGEGEQFLLVWERCKGKSEVSQDPLLPYGHPMWSWQFSHGLPKGSYQNDRLELDNITACTVKEHTEEWPLVKEKTDAEIRSMKMDKWLDTVRKFRKARLKYNERLSAEISGKA